ncbi:DUF998 domain-containing protein [Deinococcus sp. KNUC1210]|uniref:DUF998 domain-containing protein n=1 Tax=Deinococcus sp. KNUC1210 TaxID=2917691 RepID=UPI001EF02F1A|nr:DUF998 domain-containing protein [Deinococcus sp. KNUC1210]ULH15865.1 DUF998 domain-containing protein [Deinococcus sp. KNUC1210]
MEGAAELNRIRRAAVAGLLAPVIFVTVFVVLGWWQPNYDPNSMFVSELSRGPLGWLQDVNFIITGTLIFSSARFYSARGLNLPAADRSRVHVVSVLLQIIGLCLIGSGLFTTDPASLFNQHTVRGLIHGIFGAVVFSLAPVICFLMYRLFRRSAQWRAWAFWTLLVCCLLVGTVGFLKASQFPQSELYAWKGLIQRIFLLTFMAWLFGLWLAVSRAPSDEPWG